MPNPRIFQNYCQKRLDTAPSPLGEGWGEASDWQSRSHKNQTCQWQGDWTTSHSTK